MLIRFINTIGDTTIKISLSYYRVFVFSFTSLLNLFNPHNYNSKTTEILVKQIYQTSIMVIPKFLSIAFLFGSLLIGLVIFVAADYGMDLKIGSIIVTFVVNEFSALFTALFITYSFTPRLHAEITSLDKEHKITLMSNSIIPHIISAIISNLSLSILFATVMIASGYIFTFFIMDMDLHTYKYLIIWALEIENIITLLVKSILFGFTLAVIPIHNALRRPDATHSTSKIFLILFLLEILFILIPKAFNAL